MADRNGIGRVALFGGTGFVGRAIAETLGSEGLALRIAARRPGDQPNAVIADLRDQASVAAALEGCQAAVNAVGLYVEQGAARFAAVHEQGAQTLARQAAAQGLERLVHVSGIGADLTSRSAYVRSRAKGEELVRAAFPAATILRPSAIFAPNDKFINLLAQTARRAPLLPLFGRGETRLQPVYLGDVAAAAQQALRRPEAAGQTYELGGPRCYSYRELLALVLTQAGLRRPLLPVPFPVWDLLARAAGALPRPPLTDAQVELMKQDNVVGPGALGLADLGITPTALESVLPAYGFA